MRSKGATGGYLLGYTAQKNGINERKSLSSETL